jgi:hypothetical protein
MCCESLFASSRIRSRPRRTGLVSHFLGQTYLIPLMLIDNSRFGIVQTACLDYVTSGILLALLIGSYPIAIAVAIAITVAVAVARAITGTIAIAIAITIVVARAITIAIVIASTIVVARAIAIAIAVAIARAIAVAEIHGIFHIFTPSIFLLLRCWHKLRAYKEEFRLLQLPTEWGESL